jgi:hypothetical protein
MTTLISILKKELGARPRGITMLACISVMLGTFLIFAGIVSSSNVHQQEKDIVPGIKVGFTKIYGSILELLGIMYIIVSIGLWRANAWALKLQDKFLTYAITITSIFAGNLIASSSANYPISHIIGQLLAMIYTFVVARYLHNKHVQSYFVK